MTVWSYCPTHLFPGLRLASEPDLQQGEYKCWDAPRKAKRPANLALFAHCKIKEMAEKQKQKIKNNNKDMEELYCKISTNNRTRTLDIRDKETTWKAENKERQEETV